MAGVFIKKGMSISIPPGGLSVTMNDDGSFTSSLKLHVHFDVCPTWLTIALSHLDDAKARKEERLTAWSADDDDMKSDALEREFMASMQAITAAAVSIDAFYAVLKSKLEPEKNNQERSEKRRTARYAQVGEVIRRSFSLKPKVVAKLTENLKQIFEWRDRAVHPIGSAAEATYHPELQVGVEWRFAVYRYNNAHAVVERTLQMLNELMKNGKPANNSVLDYSKGLLVETKWLMELLVNAHGTPQGDDIKQVQ